MKCLKAIMIPGLMAWTVFMVMFPGTMTHATEVAGDWLSDNPSDKHLFYFGTDHTFFFENETSWFQGTYTVQYDSHLKRLHLNIEDSSDVGDVGRDVRYDYDIYDNVLVLSVADASAPFDGQDSSDRYVYIGINLDSSDDDDDEDDSNFSLYASCFIAGIDSVIRKAFMDTD
jgi:hypothetical protein